MVFFLAAALAASIWTLSAAAFPSQGSVVWSAPAPPAVSYAGQTIAPITTWPQSQWVDATTVFTAFSPSVPVAAGTMSAARDGLRRLAVRGTADYNRYPRQPATTTVSPTTLASPAGTPTHSSTVSPDPKPPGSTENTAPTIAPASPSSAGKASAGSASASALISPTTLAANTLPIAGSSSNSIFSSSPDTLPLPSGSSSASTLDSASKSKHSSTGLIVGAIVGAILSLVLATACILFFVRRRNRRLRIRERERATTAYDVAPPPIQEVDAGRVVLSAAQERLPPQYEAITGHGGPGTSSEAEFLSPPGNGKGGRTFTVG
ncbi:hypothetical protein B0H14DRAFT_3891064 [Mycena olivaceomarginata]|nr:hypothetical protein B0H14DRAFT_3891064 [Mycena olivaceomarginata]